MASAGNSVLIGLQLIFNTDTGLYDTTERGIAYGFPFSYMRDLRLRYRREVDTVANWYSKLDREGKKAVKRQRLPDNTEYFNDDSHWE